MSGDGFPVERLRELAAQIRRQYQLHQVYFVEWKGRRAHHLCGDGTCDLHRPGRMDLTDRVSLFWHGHLSELEEAEIRKRVIRILDTPL